MVYPVYTNGVAPAIDAGNLNSVNNVVQNILGNAGTPPSNGSDVRTNIGLGTMATQNANAVVITGGTISGIAGIVASGGLLAIQTFAVSGTYTPTLGMNKAVITAIGGGGAGGGAPATTAGQVALGGGGSSGSYSQSLILAATIGTSQGVTIGAGGIGVSGGNGPTGGTTSVGTLVTAPGGPGGFATGAGTIAASATVVPSTVGTGNLIASIGNLGSMGYSTFAAPGFSGKGGDSAFGGGGCPQSGSSVNGANTASKGAGGGGALLFGSTGAATGGSGGPGFVIIYEYA